VSNYDNKQFYMAERQSFHGTATTIVEEPQSAAQAIALAGLDWTVEKAPVSADVAGTQVEIPGKKALYRSDTNEVLSVMSDTYEVVQNAQAFGFVDDILGGPDLRFTSGGSLNGGKRVWLGAVLDREIYIGGDADEQIDPYIMFCNSHDGTMAVSAWITPIRLSCWNALTWSMKSAARSWKARHTKNVTGKFMDARQMLGIASRYFDDLEEIGNALITTKVSKWEMNKMVNALLPLPDGKRADEVEEGRAKTIVLNRREAIMECLKADDLANVSDTAWGFVQAVADWDDHYRGAKNADVRTDRTLFGTAAFKQRSLTIAKDVMAERDRWNAGVAAVAA
jgi:phage/plasmid-like protein (TIGR03299 family)